MQLFISIIILLVIIFIYLHLIFQFSKLQKLKKELENKEQEIYGQYSNKIKQAKSELDSLDIKLQKKEQDFLNKYNFETDEIKLKLQQYEDTKRQALQGSLINTEREYEQKQLVYKNKMNQLQLDINQATAQLQKLKDTRKAANEAMLREQQIKENVDDYRLLPSKIQLSDIKKLNAVKEELIKPRILSMLIWQTYWQPIAKNKFPIILKDKTKMGIYKITNIKTQECYIGQSVDIYKRWNEHCKAGLGIDTPPGNKLYKAIENYGLQNFTFEILTECNRNQLNEKEKYFIELYQADTYGYNSTTGNK